MVITRPEKNLFVSDAGFSVEVLGRTGMLYREGERVMKVGSEAGPPGMGMSIWATTIKAWRPPFDTEPISAEKREEIIRNIGEAIAFTQQPFTVMR
ncbi:MAG: hypothetical protein NTY35_02345 [Planctomycetota bacterium]|nr:hypothetical protein [Planctomycetota bacterium]